ncbi:hypothetical protein [Methylomagnum sp.]
MTRLGKIIAIMALGMSSAAAVAGDIPGSADGGLRYATGQNWIASSKDEKLSYLAGLGNAINAEFAYQMTSQPPPADNQTLVQKAHRGFSAYTVGQVAERIDQWYAGHPQQLGKTVLDVIWLEIIKPAPPPGRSE